MRATIPIIFVISTVFFHSIESSSQNPRSGGNRPPYEHVGHTLQTIRGVTVPSRGRPISHNRELITWLADRVFIPATIGVELTIAFIKKRAKLGQTTTYRATLQSDTDYRNAIIAWASPLEDNQWVYQAIDDALLILASRRPGSGSNRGGGTRPAGSRGGSQHSNEGWDMQMSGGNFASDPSSYDSYATPLQLGTQTHDQYPNFTQFDAIPLTTASLHSLNLGSESGFYAAQGEPLLTPVFTSLSHRTNLDSHASFQPRQLGTDDNPRSLSRSASDLNFRNPRSETSRDIDRIAATPSRSLLGRFFGRSKS